MSKKDYIAIAAILKQSRDDSYRQSVVYVAEQLAVYFKQDNPRFDTDRFINAVIGAYTNAVRIFIS